MTDEQMTTGVPAVATPRQRAQAVAKALSDAARRVRVTSRQRSRIKGSGVRARRKTQLIKLVRNISFVVIFALPVLAATIYFEFIASDEYLSEARFTVRGGMPPHLDAIGALTGAPMMLIIQDTQVVMNYLQSRTLLEDLEKSIHLRSYFTSDAIDPLSRLGPDAKIEKFLRYWKKITDVSVQFPSGIVVFSVRAFKPEDAARIADAALEASEILVNKMNDQIVKDTVSLSEIERRRAGDNLAKARAGLEKARNEEGILSADKAAEGVNSLLTVIRGELAKLQQDYDSQRWYVSENAPQLRNLKVKIESANDEITKLQALLTRQSGEGASKALSGSMSRLDTLSLENTIAEKMYATALAVVENASLASETKLMYIEPFVRPVVAQEARYPHRTMNSVLFALAALVSWGAFVGLFVLVRSKMA